ncbi:MAG: hypothetical protein K2N18_06035, partial [Clostridia bacterium]|nr:hypothetical protein [Clostridia bacterium]
DYVKSLLKYDGLYTASTVSGNRPYRATFDFDGLVEDDYNFTGTFLPAGLQSKALDWRIVQRVIPKPAYSGENLIFSAEKVDLFELFGIPEDYAEYFTINARYNNAPVTDAEYDYTAFNIGTYQLVCSFLSGINDDDENVCWDDDSITAVVAAVTLDPKRITISGWTDRIPPTPKVDDNNDLDFFNVVYTDMNGKVVTRSEITGTFNTTFKASITSKYGDNVIISIIDGFEDEIEFSTQEDPNNPAVRVAKPTLENAVLPYTSRPVTFVVNGFNDEYMTMQGGLTYTDADKYQVIIRFRDGANYCWEDGSRDPVVLEFEVFDDPDNPYVPPVPEKEPSVLDKIKAFFNNLLEKHFPLWQIATMAVAGILTVIFLIKAIQYGNRKKKVKGETKKLKGATAYAALLPIFSTETVALGMSNQLWSIL